MIITITSRNVRRPRMENTFQAMEKVPSTERPLLVIRFESFCMASLFRTSIFWLQFRPEWKEDGLVSYFYNTEQTARNHSVFHIYETSVTTNEVY